MSKVPKRKRGNQSVYSNAKADAILARLAAGESLLSICKDDGMPAESTVRLWVIDDRHGFAAKYIRARDMGLDHVADSIIEISDEVGVKTVERDGEEVGVEFDATAVARNRLRVDARKWYLSKIAPKRYGEKQQVEHSGKVSLESLVAGDAE
jgi:hypothetical protein